MKNLIEELRDEADIYSEADILEEICENGERFKVVVPEKIIDQRRWMTYYEIVVHKLDDNTFWNISWGRGSTEYQDEGVEDIECCQVWPKEVVKTVYTIEKPV